MAQLNREEGTSYRRERCLDVGDPTGKQPEVLLRAPGCQDLVLEAKSVVWPEDYLRRHRNEHLFFDAVVPSLRAALGAGAYVLEVEETSLDVPSCEVRAAAARIAQEVLARKAEAEAGRKAEGAEPFPWVFCRACRSGAGDEGGTVPQGVGVWVVGSSPPDEPAEVLTQHEAAVSGYAAAFRRQLQRAARQLARHSGCRRVFLGQFFGEDQYVEDEDLLRMVEETPRPPEVDEVWVAYRDWVSQDDYQLAWRRAH